jgi:hypothetical protein
MRFSLRLLAPPALVVATLAAAPPPAPTAPQAPVHRTDGTPDAMIDDAKALALSGTESDAVAAIATLLHLDGRAEYGRAGKALDEIAKSTSRSAELRSEAALASRSIAADEGADSGLAADRALGVATDLVVLGPFRDTGGGLDAKDGPEAATFNDLRARFAWGTVDVAWRSVPRSYAGAAGVPLDLFVHPRKESCTWVATKVTLPTAQTLVVRLASTGQARLVFDGAPAGESKDVDEAAHFDRLAAKVDAAAGAHVVAAKVCAGALDDEGRVRIRFTDANGAPLALTTSPDISDVKTAGKTKVTLEATALAHTLSSVSKVDDQLDAAIVRTLGGADDLASPRAPGILATLAQTSGLDADRLAIAAWIAPSGANRSGWLVQARARAEKSGDTRALAFVQRRLVAQHLAAHLPDWAMASRLAMKLDDATDPEAALLSASVDEALGTDALRLRALRLLSTTADRVSTSAPTGLLEKLAQLAHGADPTRELSARKLLAARGETGAEWVSASQIGGKDAVVAAAKDAFRGGLDDADDGLAAAQIVARAGAHEAARDLFGAMIRWAPNRAEGWAGLADEIAATVTPATTESEAGVQGALRRARELAPGEARYRAELALRQQSTTPSEDRDDERYLVSPATLLARRQGVPLQGSVADVADRELYWLRAVVMHADKRVSQLIHYAREIVIAPRTTDELYEEIPAEGEQTEILRARVYRKNGSVAFPTEEHNEGTRPRIRWPELEPGDTVEVAIRTWTGGPVGGRGDPPFFFLDYAGSLATHPLLYNEVDVESPPETPIYVGVANGAADTRDESERNGRHVVRLVWQKPVAIQDEPLAPPLTETVPVIVASTFKDWSAFRAWYAEAVRGFTNPDAEVKALAAKLTKGQTSREDKLRAIFDFVADDIRYVNYVSGEWWLPNRPQQLLARREGDCDDKALLLITLLRAVGIEAQEVMVQTRMTNEPSVLRAKGAAIPLFDHGIAFLPGPGGGTYLDATSPQSRLGPLPSMDARAVALRMDTGPAEIVQLPASTPDAHGSEVTWNVTLHANGDADLSAEERATGDGAFWLRTYMTEEGARAQFVQDHLVAGWLPSVEVDKQIDFKGDLPNGAAWVRYKAKSSGLARHEGADLVVPLSPTQPLASQLAPLVRRTLPVSLPPYLAPRLESRTTRFIAPKGFAWGDLPPGGDEIGGEFGRAHLEVSKEPKAASTVVVKRTLVFDASVIPVEKYAAWRAWIQRVDALMHKSLRLQRVPGGAP